MQLMAAYDPAVRREHAYRYLILRDTEARKALARKAARARWHPSRKQTRRRSGYGAYANLHERAMAHLRVCLECCARVLGLVQRRSRHHDSKHIARMDRKRGRRRMVNLHPRRGYFPYPDLHERVMAHLRVCSPCRLMLPAALANASELGWDWEQRRAILREEDNPEPR